MEVASPLAFAAAAGGSKRPLAYSPQLIESGSHEMDISDEPRFKRRRFHTDSMTDNMSPKLSHYGPSFQSNKSIFAASQVYSALKRARPENTNSCSNQKELSRVVEEQACLIESLKKEKSNLETSLQSLQNDHERIMKENQILRKAVNIQQDRQNHAESELKAAHQYREGAEEKMKKLEHLVLSLRYHLQTQHNSTGNDFLNNLPPDVY